MPVACGLWAVLPESRVAFPSFLSLLSTLGYQQGERFRWQVMEVQETIELVFLRDPSPQIPCRLYLGGSGAQRRREAPGCTDLLERSPTDHTSVTAQFSLHSELPESREKPVFLYQAQP